MKVRIEIYFKGYFEKDNNLFNLLFLLFFSDFFPFTIFDYASNPYIIKSLKFYIIFSELI